MIRYNEQHQVSLYKSHQVASKLQNQLDSLASQIRQYKRKHNELSKVIRDDVQQTKSNHQQMTDLLTAQLRMANQEKLIRNNSPLVRTMPSIPSSVLKLRNMNENRSNSQLQKSPEEKIQREKKSLFHIEKQRHFKQEQHSTLIKSYTQVFEENEAKALQTKEKIIDLDLKNQTMKRDIDDMTELVTAAKLIHINAIQAITYQEPSERTPKTSLTPVSKKGTQIHIPGHHKYSSNSKPPSQMSVINPTRLPPTIIKKPKANAPLPEKQRKKHSLSVMENRASGDDSTKLPPVTLNQNIRKSGMIDPKNRAESAMGGNETQATTEPSQMIRGERRSVSIMDEELSIQIKNQNLPQQPRQSRLAAEVLLRQQSDLTLGNPQY